MDEKVSSFKKGDLITPEQAMQLAIELAYLGAAYVSPNPLVGCVIVDRNHQILATGYHARFGAAHAEADALAKVNVDELKNATLYVTLEPCAHEGKTPSCAKAIAQLPIKKVIYGLTDPNPLVSGQGAAIIQAAGKNAVEYEGPLKKDLEDVCEIFLKNFRQKKIFIAAKVAASLDGQMGLKSGESKWITGESSREHVHLLRARYDALLVGRNTIENDNPSLNIRHPDIKKHIKLIIMDPSGSLLTKAAQANKFNFLKTHKKENIFFATKKLQLNSDYQQIEFLDLLDLTKKFWHLQIRSVLIEGGAYTYSSFLNAKLIDRLHLFLAPAVIGAANGLSWTSAFETESLQNKLILNNLKTQTFKPDIYITGTL
ncbi:MAG: bifunctional diaminohydroxyphosphoribosylaminopyrimidine deaminase/5-amino-6-(5-phosphoribosylamino)uracil reductase RibD [Bdellovibrionaceae bacterium]|nr:bifunctional diaminohydroxyphosphoribosylaminopyrimidine deaminase/5-amino-6-(5-phosphoribosylamino)uracil reductase RibD [Bdellovibrio sp.]